MRMLSFTIVIASTFAASLLLAVAHAEPRDGDVILAIAPPWVDLEAVVKASGGHLIGPTTAALGALAISENEDFKNELLENGVWAVTNGTKIAQLCGVNL